MNLRWNSSEFGGVRDLRFPPRKVWKTDVLMYNSTFEVFDGTYATNVVIRNNGPAFLSPLEKSTSRASHSTISDMKFRVWTYYGFQADEKAIDCRPGELLK
uniref:Neuronal acetylcholine receptor subunit alpha-7 n=1 Tax=Bactrocera dorsalis TaxID=27457 RepID=A0A034W814_BACDO